MPAPRIPRTVHRPAKQPRPGDSAAHVAMVRQLPCVVCGKRPVEAHHLLRVGDQLPKGMSRKNEDRWCVPLCAAHHHDLHWHGDEEAFLVDYNVDGRALARALWANRGDQDAMERVVFNTLQRKELAR